MRAKLLRILRREAKKKIQVKEFISTKGKWMFHVMRNGWIIKSYTRSKQAFGFANGLRRAYILDKIQKMK